MRKVMALAAFALPMSVSMTLVRMLNEGDRLAQQVAAK